jgi:hypothetical protein
MNSHEKNLTGTYFVLVVTEKPEISEISETFGVERLGSPSSPLGLPHRFPQCGEREGEEPLQRVVKRNYHRGGPWRALLPLRSRAPGVICVAVD